MIGDTIASALPQLQEQAESMMRDTCTITRVTGATTDPDGREIPEVTEVYGPAIEPHRGRCKVQEQQAVELSRVVAGATVTVLRYRLDVPVSAGPLRVGDLATVSDGHRFRVADLHVKSWQTAQRLTVDEVVD